MIIELGVINICNLKEVSYNRDLEVVLSDNLSYTKRINLICSRAIQNLGFLERNFFEFNHQNYLIILCVILIRPKLKSRLVISNQTQIDLENKLGKIQRRFLVQTLKTNLLKSTSSKRP